MGRIAIASLGRARPVGRDLPVGCDSELDEEGLSCFGGRPFDSSTSREPGESGPQTSLIHSHRREMPPRRQESIEKGRGGRVRMPGNHVVTSAHGPQPGGVPHGRGEIEDSVTVWTRLPQGRGCRCRPEALAAAISRRPRVRLGARRPAPRCRPRTVADEEDAALTPPSTASSAGPPADAIPGSMTAMTYGGCSWVITERKALDQAQHERRQKRGGGKIRSIAGRRSTPLLSKGNWNVPRRGRADTRVRRNVRRRVPPPPGGAPR